MFLGTRAVTLLILFGAGRLLDALVFSPSFGGPLWDVLGIALIISTKRVDYAAVNAFHGAGGTFYYTQAPAELVSTGPYSRVRNPLYLTLFVDSLGVFFLLGSIAFLIVLVGLVIGVDIVVVSREEPGLERRFGEEYLGYKARVRRWIPIATRAPPSRREGLGP